MKFQLTIDLDLSNTMRDSDDVARALRGVADHLSKFVSTNWSPYALSGKIKDGVAIIGGWEVKGDFEWNPVVHDGNPKQPERPSAIKPYKKLERKIDGRGPLVGRKSPLVDRKSPLVDRKKRKEA